MDAVLRALAIYVILMLVFRIAGKRSLAQITTFDFVLLLVIGEATQQALLGDDFSVTTAVLIILTLVGGDIGFSILKGRFEPLEKWIDGTPLVIVEDGRVLTDRMKKARVDEADVMDQARTSQGLALVQHLHRQRCRCCHMIRILFR